MPATDSPATDSPAIGRASSAGAGRTGDGARADVVVVGAGLAGLTAAATAARAGASVLVLEASTAGGRAGTTTVDPGVVFNSGPRALYAGGAAALLLGRLGIEPRGGAPDTRSRRVIVDGRLMALPGGPMSLLRTDLLRAGSKAKIAALLGRLQHIDAAKLSDKTVDQWIDSVGLGPDARAFVWMLVRLTTYCASPELSADAAVRQLQLGLGDGVLYLDRGFQQLVDSLHEVARGAGANVVERRSVTGVRHASNGGWTVGTSAGEIAADSVVLACGTPAAAQRLSSVDVHVDEVGPPAAAACLEIAVRGALPQPIVLGIDDPLYLSVHQPPADLAPDGTTVVHALRYGVRSSEVDRDDLWRLAHIGGIDHDRVVASRFLHRMIVTAAMPVAVNGGLAGRPPVEVADVDGLFLAGDWVGPNGMLADAAVDSGASAGRLCARRVRSRR